MDNCGNMEGCVNRQELETDFGCLNMDCVGGSCGVAPARTICSVYGVVGDAGMAAAISRLVTLAVVGEVSPQS